MSSRVNISQWIVKTVRIPVQRLRVGSVGHYCIRADEPADSRIVVPGPVVVKPRPIQPLAGEFPIRVQRAAGVPGRAERVIPCVSILSSGTIGYHAGAAQAVLVDVAQVGAVAQGYQPYSVVKVLSNSKIVVYRASRETSNCPRQGS